MKALAPGAGRIVFSTYRGLAACGEGTLARVDATSLLEFRTLPRFELRRIDSVAFFIRSITINQAPARLMGAFRIAPDSALRSGYYGYAVSSMGRDEQAMDAALDDLDAIAALDIEADIQALVPGQAFAHFKGSGRVEGALVERYQRTTTASVFGLEAEVRRLDILHTLWRLSWLDDSHETFVAFTDPRDERLLDAPWIEEIHSTYEDRYVNRTARAAATRASEATSTSHSPRQGDSLEDRPQTRNALGLTLEEPAMARLRPDDLPGVVELHRDAIERLSNKVVELEREISSLRSRVYSLSQSSPSRRVENGTRHQRLDAPNDRGLPVWLQISLAATGGLLLIGLIGFGVAVVMDWL